MLTGYQHEINLKTVGDNKIRRTDEERAEVIQREMVGTFRAQAIIYAREFSEGMNEYDSDRPFSRGYGEWIHMITEMLIFLLFLLFRRKLFYSAHNSLHFVRSAGSYVIGTQGKNFIHFRLLAYCPY